MKKVLLALCLMLTACEHKKEERVEQPPPPKVPCDPPVVIPTSTNPFEKPPPPPPAPVHEPFKPPQWEQIGEYKINKEWSFWTWRDAANHNTCYLYTVTNGGHGMSCVKE